jgi:hypothetical protein
MASLCKRLDHAVLKQIYVDSPFHRICRRDLAKVRSVGKDGLVSVVAQVIVVDGGTEVQLAGCLCGGVQASRSSLVHLSVRCRKCTASGEGTDSDRLHIVTATMARVAVEMKDNQTTRDNPEHREATDLPLYVSHRSHSVIAVSNIEPGIKDGSLFGGDARCILLSLAAPLHEHFLVHRDTVRRLHWTWYWHQ